ncbi:MAG: rubrerythrin family protein [Spirochaetia bacterium]|jgi:rubrerythrin|nr:rubrerythrin family protein [Spirochaetia bacterium]
MAVKNAMTSEFLHSAYAGESMAHMRYLIWGDMAEKEGFPNVARLFKAIAFAERIHAGNHFKAIGGATASVSVTGGGVFGVGKTVDNLQGAIDGEAGEVNQMYPVYLHTAEFQDEPEAKRSFHAALEVEKLHLELFKQAQQAVRAGHDMELKKILVCPVCGHTVLDEAPEHCPICNTKKEKYVEF